MEIDPTPFTNNQRSGAYRGGMGLCVITRIIAWMAASVFCFGGAVSASADVGRAVSTCTVRAVPGMTARILFADPARFDCDTPQVAFGEGDFWILSRPLPQVSRERVNVRYGTTWMDRTSLHVLYADGAIRSLHFTSATIGRHVLLGAATTIPVPRRDARPVRLLWHIRHAANLRGLLLGVTLATDDEIANSEVVRAALFGAFGGLLAGLMIYNLALWGALRQRFQPVYCGLMLCLLAYGLSSSGALAMLCPALDNNDRHRLNVVLLAMSGTMALAFARSFFERAVFTGWLRRASITVMLALMGAAVLWALLAPLHIHVLDRLLSFAYLAMMLLVPAILWRAWRVRSNYLWLFAIAWGAPITMGAMRVASVFGLIRWAAWLDQSTILSMAIEALLSSTAIAYRIRLLSRERDVAREQEIAARLLADTDPLTGLLNRRAFLSQAIGRPGMQTLLVADLDHFKRVNETIGHDGGDEVLRVFARALRRSVPPGTLIARIGGEEFAILADSARMVEPSVILEHLRSERMPYDIPVTASIGRCTGPLLREADWKTLYRRADLALFAAKAGGRDSARDAMDLIDAA